MNQINSKIVADSVCPKGHRLTTFLITFPRYILAELNTHRMLSKNSASSRAIPFNKMIKSVEENPFIPIAWQKEHTGMQGTEYFTDEKEIKEIENLWLNGKDAAIIYANSLHYKGVTKQLCNRELEAYMMHTVLISGTEWENFFALRCPQYQFDGTDKVFRSRKDATKYYPENSAKDKMSWLYLNKGMADIHMMALAECMWDAYNESIPKKLDYGDWHIPFSDDINIQEVAISLNETTYSKKVRDVLIKISTARCARTSYTTVGENKVNTLEQDIALHDRFINQSPLHASPFEHCAKVMNSKEYCQNVNGKFLTATSGNIQWVTIEASQKHNAFGWCKNYHGFIQYRALLSNENIKQIPYETKE